MSKKLKKRNSYQDHCMLSPQTSENFTLSEKMVTVCFGGHVMKTCHPQLKNVFCFKPYRKQCGNSRKVKHGPMVQQLCFLEFTTST